MTSIRKDVKWSRNSRLRKLFHFGISVILMLLSSCANPSNSDESGESDGGIKKSVTIIGHGWYVENIDTAFWTNDFDDASVFASFLLKYYEDLDISDFKETVITSPLGHNWTVSPESMEVDLESKWITIDRRYRTADPLRTYLGEWTATVFLKNGNSASQKIIVNEPGSLTYTNTAVTVSAPSAGEVSILKRPTVSSADKSDGGVTITFSINDARVHNGYIWFYDADNAYLGTSRYFINDSGTPHACLVGALNVDGQLNTFTVTEDSIPNTSLENLDNVAKCVVVVTDGAQYLPHHTYWDYRGIGSRTLIASE